MSGQQWRFYALMLQLFAAYKAATWLLDHLGNPWGYIGTVFVAGWSLVGLIVPVTQERAVRYRRGEVVA